MKMRKEGYILSIISIDRGFKKYIDDLKYFLQYFGLKYKIINLPKVRKKITLLKSPHVNKKAREQFEFIKFKKVILVECNTYFSNINFMKYMLMRCFDKPKSIRLHITKTVYAETY